ncbi:MAG: HIRAN domain-containing protein [Treponema sp.]|jgi:hypothetical protein|nr:HIRAN domain-containing protein [Treponema sp.]
MNKATVFQIGNRLSKTMDRRDAFCKAWELVKKGTLEIPVNGTSFYNRPLALKRLARYEPSQRRAVLVAEPDNRHDRNAIAVFCGVTGGKGIFRIGYVPKSMTAIVSAIKKQLPSLRVLSGDIYGAKIQLAV